MNIINKLLILIIVVLLINYLTEGNVINMCQKYFYIAKDKILNTNLSSQSYDLNYVLKKISYPNFKMKKSHNNNFLGASKQMISILQIKLLKYFNKKLKDFNYRATNLNIIDNNINYLKNPKGKYFSSLIINVNLLSYNVNLGIHTLMVELFVDDNNKLTIISINMDNNNTDILTDDDHIDYNLPKSKSKSRDKSLYANDNANDNNNYNHVFIKANANGNANDNDNDSDLIPSSINVSEVSSYYTSDTQLSS